MRIFPFVFEEAQKILKKDYSMELVEYPTRGTSIQSLNQSKFFLFFSFFFFFKKKKKIKKNLNFLYF